MAVGLKRNGKKDLNEFTVRVKNIPLQSKTQIRVFNQIKNTCTSMVLERSESLYKEFDAPTKQAVQSAL